MRTKLYTFLLAAILLPVLAVPGNATLVGTAVTGSLTFSGDPSNYFDPGYGFVPAGYLNTSGTTVTVSDSAVEFGYDDGASRISANFSDSSVTISDLTELPGPTNAFRLTFTDAAFTGQHLVAGADSLPLSDYSLSGDVITLDYLGGNPSQEQTLDAVFTVTSAPEPATLGFIAISALLLRLRRPRRAELWIKR
jgi:uncharacterized membrane protein